MPSGVQAHVIEELASPAPTKNQVFKSVNGYYWYLRLRGWEIDAVDSSGKVLATPTPGVSSRPIRGSRLLF
jgi:hypothetical protein